MTAIADLPRTETLAELEGRVLGLVEQINRDFRELGRVMGMIRDARLYRDTHFTWNDYCRDLLGRSGTHADRIISAASEADALAPFGAVPGSEAHVRALRPLRDPAIKARVFGEVAAACGKPTMAAIEEAVEHYLAGADQSEPEEIEVSEHRGGEAHYAEPPEDTEARFAGRVPLRPSRELVLCYPAEEYVELARCLQALKTRHGVASTREIVLKILRDAANDS